MKVRQAVDGDILSKQSKKAKPARESRAEKKRKREEKMKTLKKWGNMKKRDITEEQEKDFQIIEYKLILLFDKSKKKLLLNLKRIRI